MNDPRSKHNQQKNKHSERQRNWGVWGCCEPLSGGFRGQSPLRKFLGSKDHLDWLKIDLNVAEIITVQDYKCKKINLNGKTHIVLKLRVKHVTYNQGQRYNDNTKRPKSKENQPGIFKIILLENSAEGLGSRREHCWGYISIYTGEKLPQLPLKVAATLLSGSRKGPVGA